MKRILTLWLALLATFWLARALVEAFAEQRADLRPEQWLALAAIPALQALALGWATRSPGPSPVAELARAVRRSPLLLVLLALDLALPALALALPDQAWLTPALGDAPDGNPVSLLAAAESLGAAILFFRLAAKRGDSRPARLRLAAFGAALAALAALLAVDLLSLLGEVAMPASSPLFWKLALHGPALAAGLALLFAVEPSLPERGPARAALEAAAACAWIAALLALTGSAFEGSPTPGLAPAAALLALAGATALVAAARFAELPSGRLSPLPEGEGERFGEAERPA